MAPTLLSIPRPTCASNLHRRNVTSVLTTARRTSKWHMTPIDLLSCRSGANGLLQWERNFPSGAAAMTFALSLRKVGFAWNAGGCLEESLPIDWLLRQASDERVW